MVGVFETQNSIVAGLKTSIGKVSINIQYTLNSLVSQHTRVHCALTERSEQESLNHVIHVGFSLLLSPDLLAFPSQVYGSKPPLDLAPIRPLPHLFKGGFDEDHEDPGLAHHHAVLVGCMIEGWDSVEYRGTH